MTFSIKVTYLDLSSAKLGPFYLRRNKTPKCIQCPYPGKLVEPWGATIISYPFGDVFTLTASNADNIDKAVARLMIYFLQFYRLIA